MHTKSGRSFLGGPEKYLVKRFTKYVPLETYHLTLLTLVWSALVLVAGYLAQKNIDWLWLTVAAIVLQYITDLFDGAVGRYRKTGLVKWGFYMDHYLDYVFLACFVASFGFLLPNIHMLALTVILAAGFMISTFLDFGQQPFLYGGKEQSYSPKSYPGLTCLWQFCWFLWSTAPKNSSGSKICAIDSCSRYLYNTNSNT